MVKKLILLFLQFASYHSPMTYFRKWHVSPKQDLNLGPSRIAVFEDCKATALTTKLLRISINGVFRLERIIIKNFSISERYGKLPNLSDFDTINSINSIEKQGETPWKRSFLPFYTEFRVHFQYKTTNLSFYTKNPPKFDIIRTISVLYWF